jgi:lysophospholipase L1-like esterase
MSLNPHYLLLAAALTVAACSDASTNSPPRTLDPTSPADESRVARTPERYVAMGTSISMGWMSNGVYGGSQVLGWPELLAFGSARPISLPLIQAPGCTSPLVAPLGANTRLSGEGFAGSAVCAPLVAGVTLPTQNVALATAIAADAVLLTPEAAGPTKPFYSRVLPPGTTQLTASLGQNPTIVSLELGGNDVLFATSGLYLPGVTVTPFPYFAQPYDAILNALSATHTKAVLVGMPTNSRNLAAMRRGDEIWANRDEFAALHVTVSDDCNGSDNYVNVSLKSMMLVFAGAAAAANNQPNPVYSCADIPGVQDLVLTPNDMNAIDGLMAQMSAHIRDQAAARGFAYFSLGTVYDRPDLKGGAYSVVKQLTSKFPYGFYTSLDGVHPGPIGHVLLAAAAAKAINTTYGDFGVNGVAHARETISLGDRLDDELLPSEALAMARRIAHENRNTRVSTCGMPGGCDVRRAMQKQ